jgi:hypothetical protein
MDWRNIFDSEKGKMRRKTIKLIRSMIKKEPFGIPPTARLYGSDVIILAVLYDISIA